MRHRGIFPFLVGGILLIGATFNAHSQPTDAAKIISSSTKANGANKATKPMNQQLLEFCQAKVGQKVGDGQCGEFVAEGIRMIGARLRFPAFPNKGDYVWGDFVCSLEGQNGNPTLRTNSAETGGKMEPGDVIQYRDVFFSGPTATGTYYTQSDHHTAVIESVSADGNTCEILEQNFDDKQYVTRRSHYLPDLQRGVMRVYRPIALPPRSNFSARSYNFPPVQKPQTSSKAPTKQKPSRHKSP